VAVPVEPDDTHFRNGNAKQASGIGTQVEAVTVCVTAAAVAASS
jgi:hypothetical protein